MEKTCFYNLFVGCKTGLMKGVNLVDKTWNNLNDLTIMDNKYEVDSLCWGSKEQKNIFIGYSNQQIVEYNIDNNTFKVIKERCYDSGHFCGLEVNDNILILCNDGGYLNTYNLDDNTLTKFETTINLGKDVCRMRQSNINKHLVATGGKENTLKIWDLNRPDKPTFSMKNVKHDWLNLRVPIWIKDLRFTNHSNKIFTCTAYHQVRLYDPASNRKRPVLEFEYDEYPLISMAMTNNENQVIVGNTHGNIVLIDMRKFSRLVCCFKGAAGSIKSIECHETLPFIGSCGLDRSLRVHNLETKEMCHKFYLKSKLNCLLFSNLNFDKQVEDTIKDDMNDLWNQMPVIKENPTNKKTLSKKYIPNASRKRKRFNSN